MIEHDLSTREGQMAYEEEARLFSVITTEANDMAPLLNQTFKARVKSNSETFKWLCKSLSGPENANRLSGKTLDVEIDWSYHWPVVRLPNFFGNGYHASLCAKHFTQIGILPKMVKAHKKAFGN